MRLHRTKKLLHGKGNHQQNKKAMYGMREQICKSHTDKGLIYKIYNEFIELNSKKKKEKKTLIDTENRLVVARGGEMDKMGSQGQKERISTYKLNK